MLSLDPARFGKTDLHIHVPAGAVPKDGPSAGVAIASALISFFRGVPIVPNLAMTGEVTLTGRVLPVGGVREKILAARRAGIKMVLLPRHNEKDLVDIPAEVKADLTVRLVDTLRDVVAYLFEMPAAGAKTSAHRAQEEKPARRLERTKLPNGRKDSLRGLDRSIDRLHSRRTTQVAHAETPNRQRHFWSGRVARFCFNAAELRRGRERRAHGVPTEPLAPSQLTTHNC